MGQARVINVTIASGAATSGDIGLMPGERIAAIQTPATWTAADIYVQVAADGTTYLDLKDAAGTTIKACTSVATGAAELRVLAHETTAGLDIPFGPMAVRLRSVNTGSTADVNQGADRVIKVIAVTSGD